MNQYHHLGPQPPPLTAAEQKHAEVVGRLLLE